MSTKTKIVIVLAAVVLVFAAGNLVMNMEPITFYLWPFATFEISKTVFGVAAFVKGVVLTLLAQWYWRRSHAVPASTPSQGAPSSAAAPAVKSA